MKRFSSIYLVLLTAFLLACASQGENQTFGSDTRALNQTDIQRYSLTIVEEGYDITVKEIERGPNFSLLEINIRESPTVTASGVVVAKAQFEIAKERGFEYYFLAPSRREGGVGNEGILVGKTFFTNDNTVNRPGFSGDWFT
jgi:hypothetical protein